MAITRSQIVGALKLLNANNTTNRRGHIQNMLAVEHTVKDVAKALRDIETYAEWTARADLETAASVDDPAIVSAIAAPTPRRKKS